MASPDIIELLSTEADKAVDQIIEDSKRLHVVVNGDGTAQATTEDGSLIPSVRKALLDNLYFKTPPLPWRNGGAISEFNQLYGFTDAVGNTTWWYAPGATTTNQVIMGDNPMNDIKFKIFLDKTNISLIYAPLLSPDFKGNPRVPLAAEDDNTNTIASTEFVTRAVEAVKQLIVDSNKTIFDDITVRKKATIKDIAVSGAFDYTGPLFNAGASTALLNKIRLTGASADISFENSGAAPVGVTTKTYIKPWEVVTGKLGADDAKFVKANVGNTKAAGDSFNVDGNMRGDYLTLDGNGDNPADRALLVVNGKAIIRDLEITGTTTGIYANVDGTDIKPRSVTIERQLVVGTNATVAGTLGVTGKTTVKDLEVTGNFIGPAFSVDGKDIRPKSVVSEGGVSVGGNLQITGTTTATGDMTVGNLNVTGKLTANLDLAGSDLDVKNLNVSETATIKDLVVTGTVTGVTADVDGKDIKPKTVVTTGDVTVGANLNVQGSINLTDLDITGDATVGGVTTLKDLVVTGTVTGITASVDGKAIKPLSVETGVTKVSTLTSTGDVTVGGDLHVTGALALTDLDIAGNIKAASETLTGNLSVGATATVKDLVVTGTVTGIVANVDGKNIEPNKVTAGYIEFENMSNSAVTGTWVPPGDKNMHVLTITGETTIGPWPGLGNTEKPKPFSAMIYLTQANGGGHAVHLDSSYYVMNPTTEIKLPSGSVSILQLTYCGVGAIVDVLVATR